MYIQKWEQKAIFKKFQDNILVENDDFIRLLKVIGNNHKYDLRTQMSIATFRDTSTACADFNFWNNKANRFIRKYEVGIPVFNQDEEITGYIFDVSQTVKTKYTNDNIVRWELNNENILDNIIELDKDLSTSEKIDLIIKENIKEYPQVMQENELKFIEESLKISIKERLKIPYEINSEIVEFRKDFSESTYKFLDIVNNINIDILNEISKEDKEVYTAISPMNFYERQGGKYTIETLDGQKILLPEGIEVIDLDKILEMEEIKYWGRERVRYLEEEKPQLLKELMTTKELIPHLIAIQEEVKKFIEIEKPKMMKSWGITEEHQSLMNNFQSSLKEIIYQEIIQR